MRISRRLENLHHLAKSSLVSGRHTTLYVYSIKKDNEMAIFQRLKLSHWLRAHSSKFMGETFKSATPNSFFFSFITKSQIFIFTILIYGYNDISLWVCFFSNSFYYQLYSIPSSEGISERLFPDLEKSSNWLPLILVPSLLCLSTTLNVEVLLSRDCVADTVQRYPMFILTLSPFSITAHRGWKSQTLTSPVSLI